MTQDQDCVAVDVEGNDFEFCSDGIRWPTTFTYRTTYHRACYNESCTEHKELTIG
jgi:hypothetical protein